MNERCTYAAAITREIFGDAHETADEYRLLVH